MYFFSAFSAQIYTHNLHLLLQQVGLAKEFESLVRADKRFEICAEVVLGLVCFRLKVTTPAYADLLYNCSGQKKVKRNLIC